MAEQAYAYVTLIPVAKGFQSAVAKELSGVGGEGGKAGKAAGDGFTGGFGTALKGLAKVAATAFATVGVVDFFKDSVSAASNFNAEFEGVNQVFGSAASGVQAFAASAATNLGISETAALNASKQFGIFATSAGLTGDAAAGFSTQLVQAAADLGSFNDVPVEQTLAAITSGLQGSSEPLRQFGIFLDETSVAAYAANNGLGDAYANMTSNEKTLVRQAALMEQMGVQAGDFANYAGDFGNAQKTLAATFEDMQAKVGQALIPALEALMPILTSAVTELEPLITEVAGSLAPIFETLAANIQPLISSIEPLFAVIVDIIGVLGTIIAELLPPAIKLINMLVPVVVALAEALIPVVQDLLPIFAGVIEQLLPFLDVLFEQISTAIVPVIGVFAEGLGQLIEVAGEIISIILPPLVEILSILAPVIVNVITAILPLVAELLPLFAGLLTAITPVIQVVADLLNDYVVPALTWFADVAGDFVQNALAKLNEGIQWLGTLLGPVWDFLKPILEGLLALAGIKPAALQKTVTVSATKTGDKEVWDVLGGKSKAADSAFSFDLGSFDFGKGSGTSLGKVGADNKKKLKALIKDTKADLKAARVDYKKAVAEANKDYLDAQTKITEAYDKAVLVATKRRDEGLASALKDYNANVASINEQAAKDLADIVQQSMNRLRDAYRSAAEVNISDMFASDAINKNVTGLIDGLREKLTASRALLDNAAKLASAGFSQTFIEQVVAAGTETGNELAQGILNASPEQQAELQNLFTTIDQEASHGMDQLAQTLYEKNGLATEELKNMYASVLTEQQIALAEQKTAYDNAVAEIMLAFEQEIADAKATRDEALLDAEKTLNEALIKANEDFVAELDKIQTQFKEKVKAFKSEAKDLAKEISALNDAVAGSKSAASTRITGLNALLPMATGGLVTGPTPALVGEAGPELVIPLDRFQSLVEASGGSGKTVNYYAAPNQSIDNEAALFQAMRRAKVVANW